MTQLLNIRNVTVPSLGKLPLSEKPGTFTPSATKREHKAGRLAEDGGYMEVATPAKLELSLNLRSGMDFAALGAIQDEDVTVRLADGQVYVLFQAFATEPVAVSDGEAKLTLMANTSERMS
jgi:hypothetical protein